MMGKIKGRRRRGQQEGIIESMHMSLSKLWKMVDREDWSAAIHGVTHGVRRDLATEQDHTANKCRAEI